MSFWNWIADKFHPAPPPNLRNKPDGMAWIKGCGGPAAVLNGRAVKTVRQEGGYWTLDPVQQYVISWPMEVGGYHVPGIAAEVVALHDDLLEPMKDVGDGEQDESAAWLPPVPSTKQEDVS